MAECLMAKQGNALVPGEPAADEYLRTLGQGELIRCKFSKPRNPAFHRKFFALLQLGYENQDSYRDFEQWRRAVVIEAGFFEDLRLMDGTVQREARSIAFGNMDETEFHRLFYAAVDVIARFLGTDNQALAREVENFMWSR